MKNIILTFSLFFCGFICLGQSGEILNEEIKEDVPTELFTHHIDVQPMPKGGFPSFYRYVAENMTYPPAARRNGIEGKVYVQFVVDKDGSIIDVEVIKGIGGGCDEEALIVVQNSDKWIPGEHQGEIVKVSMILPITFNLGKKPAPFYLRRTN